ncbi:MAG: ATP-binding protein [Balneolaceae bacterium]|nr:ATP-binding protein [Balneolaceae bacterium]
MTEQDSKELILKSEFDEVQKLEGYINELQEWLDFNDNEYSRIMLTLSEAATNAIIHGNKEDPSKKVYINSSADSGTLKISVKDEGAGFNPDEIKNPLKKENLLNEGGRGVYLIEEYADKLSFNKKGNELQMTFKLN